MNGDLDLVFVDEKKKPKTKLKFSPSKKKRKSTGRKKLQPNGNGPSDRHFVRSLKLHSEALQAAIAASVCP